MQRLLQDTGRQRPGPSTTRQPFPTGNLRLRSPLRIGIEEPCLQGYQERSRDYLLMATERI